jgi:hypothetical protein
VYYCDTFSNESLKFKQYICNRDVLEMEANLQPTKEVGMFFVADQSHHLVVVEAEVTVDMEGMAVDLVETEVAEVVLEEADLAQLLWIFPNSSIRPS